MTDLQAAIEQRVQAAVGAVLGADLATIDPQVRPAADSRFGDYQADLAMGLAKRLGQPPRAIAESLAQCLRAQTLFDSVAVAGPGFINLRLRQRVLDEHVSALLTDERLGVPVLAPQTAVVDYSSPNVAKEMHVGHLRSTVLGDALVRVLEFLGQRVIRQNHLGDWGTQFGMLIEYMLDSGATAGASYSVADLNALYQAAKRRFDDEPAFAERARGRVVALQGGDPDTLALWHALVDESERHFADAYRRLGVKLTPADSRGESFYNPRLADVIAALERLHLVEQSAGALVVYPPGFSDRTGAPQPMIVRKADGGYLYTTTDLAAARYRIDELGAERLIYVTDARQKDHFAMLFAMLRQSGWADEHIRLEHVAFGSILGKDRKPFKTRTGGTIKLSELLDEAERRAAEVIRAKSPEMPVALQEEVARIVGIGALKYADLATQRNKDCVFDWERMLALDGNTAPYLQNAYVRIQAIFRKGNIAPDALAGVSVSIGEPPERLLALHLAQLPRVVLSVADTLEPHRLCNYLYGLASGFHHFYEHCPVLTAADEPTRRSRLALCQLVARTLERGLALLSIGVVDYM